MTPPAHFAPRGGPEVTTDSVAGDTRPPWLQLATTSDHKGIGRMYIASALVFLTLALTELVLMRIQLMVPQFGFMRPEIFDRLLSIYPVTATLLFALPLLIGLMSYIVPLQIGSRGFALPRLHQLSFWLFLAGAAALYFTLLYRPPEAGSASLAPLSGRLFSPNDGVDGWAISVGLCSTAFILFAISALATLRNLRAPGMSWGRTPAFSWAARVISYLLLVICPVMIAAVSMLFIDRNFGGVFFNPGEGGAPVYYQHLSALFFSGVYAAILIGAFGAISDILPTFSGRTPIAPRTIGFAFSAFATLVPLAWMQNMYSVDIPIGFLYFTMFVALAAAVPFAMLLFAWIGAAAGGAKSMRAPMKFATAAVVLITIGLAGELAQAVVPVGWRFDNTMLAWGDTHIALVGAAVLGGFAALAYWFPKLGGRLMGEGLASASIAGIVLGTLLMGVSAWLAGFQGMAADVYKFYEGDGVGLWNVLTLLGALLLAGGVIAGLIGAATSWTSGTTTGPDPWRGATLEWFAPSPPPPHNFDLVPDVRSSAPLADIRRAVSERASDWTPPPATSGKSEQVPVSVGGGDSGESAKAEANSKQDATDGGDGPVA